MWADPVGRLIFVADDPGVPEAALHDPLAGLAESTAADACLLLEAKQIGSALLSGNVLQRDIPLRGVPNTQRRRALGAGGNNVVRSMGRIRRRAESALRPVLEGLAAGWLSLADAQEQSAPVWRDIYERVRDVGRRASGLSRLGGDPTVYREEEVWFRSAVREEVGYWNTFLAEVDAGRVNEDRMERRFDAYLNAMRFMYEATRVASLPDDVLLYWAGPEDEKRCPGCVYMQARSPFTKDTIPAVPRDGMTNCLTNCRHKIVVRIPESVGSVFRRRMELPRRAHMVRELKEIRRERSRARAMQIALGVPPRERTGSRSLRPVHQTARTTERARNPFRGTPITAPPPVVPFTRRGRRVRVTPTGFIQESVLVEGGPMSFKMPPQLFTGSRPSAAKMQPIKNIPHVKPRGGLWTSTYVPAQRGSDWTRWADSERFAIPKDAWLLIPKRARLYVVNTLDDLKRLMELYPRKGDTGYASDRPDYEALAKDFDGMYVTARGQRETRMSYPYDLYGWDVESTVWFRWVFGEPQPVKRPEPRAVREAKKPDPAKRAKKIAKVRVKEQEKVAKANQRHQEKLAKIAQGTQDAMKKIAMSETEQPTGPASGDIVDAGAAGKQFEEMFVKALRLLGLSFETNRATGALWDIRPTGKGWHSLVKDRDTNLKVHSTRWLFSDGSTYHAAVKAHRMVKRGTLTPEQADTRVRNRLRKSLNGKGLAGAAFMKPRSKEVQDGIVQAARAGDKDRLRELLVAKNFATKRFGRFKIEVDIDWSSDEWESTGYIRIDGGVGGKTMGATGRARKIGGVWTFAFRDRSASAKKPHHKARTAVPAESVSERDASRGIARLDMPQIPGDVVPAFLAWLKREHNISHSRKTIRAGRLHPTQGEFNMHKVRQHAANRRVPPLHVTKPVLVSSDLYVLDGHHRWLEALYVDPNERVHSIVINARIDRLFDLAHAFPGAGERRGVSRAQEARERVAALLATDEEDVLYDPGLAQAVKRAGFDSVDQAADAVRLTRDRKRVKKLSKRVRRKLVGPAAARDGKGLELLNDEWPRMIAPIAESVSATWDSVPYSSMRIQDVARLFDGASRAKNLNAGTILKIINRLIGSLEFAMMSAVGRPEADRASKLIRGALDRLSQRVTLRESSDDLGRALARLEALL